MEKFGIFNILSALSNLTNTQKNTPAPQSLQNAAPKNDQTPAPTPAPEYAKYNPMLDLIKRHDEISRRIDQNNKK